jgi:hypothetical protein
MFPKCGLDFRVKDWDKETPEEFKKHLDVLHEEQLYQSLTEAHKATKLEKKAPPSTFSKNIRTRSYFSRVQHVLTIVAFFSLAIQRFVKMSTLSHFDIFYLSCDIGK